MVRSVTRSWRSTAVNPSTSKVSGAPFFARRPHSSKTRLSRWNPSIGTTTARTPSCVSRACRRADTVDFPLAGGPAIASRIRPPMPSFSKTAWTRVCITVSLLVSCMFRSPYRLIPPGVWSGQFRSCPGVELGSHRAYRPAGPGAAKSGPTCAPRALSRTISLQRSLGAVRPDETQPFAKGFGKALARRKLTIYLILGNPDVRVRPRPLSDRVEPIPMRIIGVDHAAIFADPGAHSRPERLDQRQSLDGRALGQRLPKHR